MIKLNGFNLEAVTFTADGTINDGAPVYISAEKTAKAAASDAVFCGTAVHSEDGRVLVNLSGYTELPYTGATAPSYGYNTLTANGTGGVTVNASGRSYLVVSIDTTAKICGIIL